MEEQMTPHLDPESLDFFRREVKKAEVYVEYGCGGSTVLAFNESNAKIICVDSDWGWLWKVLKSVGADRSRIDAHYCKMGRVEKWGYPFSKKANGSEYASWPWTRTSSAELVLVDGRFRVACFLKSVVKSAPGTLIMFEDYGEEYRGYSVVERVIKPSLMVGRCAVFRVPESLDTSLAESMFSEFVRNPA